MVALRLPCEKELGKDGQQVSAAICGDVPGEAFVVATWGGRATRPSRKGDREAGGLGLAVPRRAALPEFAGQGRLVLRGRPR